MSIAIFTWCPRLSASTAAKFSVRTASFGDGYTQVSGNGLNPLSEEWSVEFTGTGAYIAAIVAFIKAHNGYQAFQWSPPLEATGLFRCEEYNTTALGNDKYNLSCTFKTAYDLSKDSDAQIAPTITTQPQSVNVMQNAGATFTVAAAGSQPFTYKWEKSLDGVAWSQVATANQYTITQTTLADTSQIRVTVTNAYGNAVSEIVNLTVQEQPSVPSITTQPAVSTQKLVGGQVLLTANAVGSGTLTWQWQKQIGSSWVNIGDQFLSTLTLNNVATSDAGLYRAIVSNNVGQATTNNATVDVQEYVLDLTLDTLPDGLSYTGSAKYYRSVSDMLAQTAANTWAVEYSGNTRAGRSLPQPSITNLLLSPFNVSSTDWTLNRATAATGLASPDGNINGVKLIPSVDNGTHFTSQNFTKENGATYTFSVFLKAAGLNYAMIQVGNVSYLTNPQPVYVDLVNGLVVATDSTRVVLKPYGNGWYRASVTVTTNSTGTVLPVQIYAASGTATGSETFAGNAVDGILVWGAMAQKAGLPLRALPVGSASAAENAAVLKDHGATRFELTYNTGAVEIIAFGTGTNTALPVETLNWQERFISRIRYLA